MKAYSSFLPSWSEPTLKRIALSFAIAVCIALILFPYVNQDTFTSYSTGDFPSFYTAGKIIAFGKGETLYDLNLQSTIQHQLFPDMEGMYMYAYPPWVAALLAPLTWLSAPKAKFLFSLIQLFALLGCGAVISRMKLFGSLNLLSCTGLLICCGPIFISVVGAQNTAFSLLFFLSSLQFLRLETKRGDLLAGLITGLWLFKPQLGLPFLLLLILFQRWNAVAASLSIALPLYFVSAFFSGVFWPVQWAQFSWSFSALDLQANAHQMVSISGGFYSLASFGGSEVFANYLSNIGKIVGALCLILFFVRAQRARTSSSTEISHYWCLLGLFLPLLSPHALFYDSALQYVALLLLVTGSSLTFRANLWFGLGTLSWGALLIKEHLPIPFFFFLSVLLAFALIFLRSPKQSS